MKRLLFAALIALIGVPVLADDDFSLYILSSGSSTPATYAVSDIQKITFDNGNVVVTKTDGTSASVAMSSITSMYVDKSNSEAVQGLSFSSDMESAAVYDLQGRLVTQHYSSFKNNDGIAPGIYVVYQNGRSYKIIKR